MSPSLSHTGGVPDHFANFNEDPDTLFDRAVDYTTAELVEAFLALYDRLVAPPSTEFNSSNTDYAMLTAVIEQVGRCTSTRRGTVVVAAVRYLPLK